MELLEQKKELSYEERLKIRNKEICSKYLDWYDQDMYKIELVRDLMARLTLEYDLTQVSIYQILKANHNLIEFHKGWEKHKRICELKRLRGSKTNSNKDVADLIDQERKEIEGDKPSIDLSQHHTLILQIEKENDSEIKTARKAMAGI